MPASENTHHRFVAFVSVAEGTHYHPDDENRFFEFIVASRRDGKSNMPTRDDLMAWTRNVFPALDDDAVADVVDPLVLDYKLCVALLDHVGA